MTGAFRINFVAALALTVTVTLTATMVPTPLSAQPATQPAASPPGGAVAGQAAGPEQPAQEDREALLRTKVLRDEDFVENDEINRDPFRSFLRIFGPERIVIAPQAAVPAIFDKFALEELALIAIVSGTAKPLAMFRDPSGLGQSISRGDYISKSGARVTKILSDRVIVEITESGGSVDGPRIIEKAILINPENAQP